MGEDHSPPGAPPQSTCQKKMDRHLDASKIAVGQLVLGFKRKKKQYEFGSLRCAFAQCSKALLLLSPNSSKNMQFLLQKETSLKRTSTTRLYINSNMERFTIYFIQHFTSSQIDFYSPSNTQTSQKKIDKDYRTKCLSPKRRKPKAETQAFQSAMWSILQVWLLTFSVFNFAFFL